MSKPEYYATRTARLDTLAGPGGQEYFNMLVRLVDSYKQESSHLRDFAEWCSTTHGFRPVYDDEGGITSVPEIIDSQKYTLCLLKYSG